RRRPRVLRPRPRPIPACHCRLCAACRARVAAARASSAAQRRATRTECAGACRLPARHGVVMRVDRARLPALGADPPLRFPEIRRRTLSNGLRVWTVEHHAVPLVSFLALLPIGASADPIDRPGLAAITSDMLDEGCGDLDAMELHDTL